MKQLFFVISFILCGLSLKLVLAQEGSSPIKDDALILSESEESDLKAALGTWQKKSGVEVKVDLVLSTFSESFDEVLASLQQAIQNDAKKIYILMAVNDRRVDFVVSKDLESVFAKINKAELISKVKFELFEKKYFLALAKFLSIIEERSEEFQTNQLQWFQVAKNYWFVYSAAFFCGILLILATLFYHSNRIVLIIKQAVPLVGMLFVAFIYRSTDGYWWAYGFCFVVTCFIFDLIQIIHQKNSKALAGLSILAMVVSSQIMWVREVSFLKPQDVLFFFLGHIILCAIIVGPLFVLRQIALVIGIVEKGPSTLL